MDYRTARGLINEAQRFGGEMGLEQIRCLLGHLSNPQKDLRFIHIAGTNGKGSVGAYLASVLKEAGYDVGRFISPTIFEYRERIQWNNEYISEEDYGLLMDEIAAAIEEIKEAGEPLPSPFEIETALSFLYYKKKKCDFVLLECGMGGETDATNLVTTTELAVITSISMDHMEYLGDTLAKIAKQKAGIIKPGCSVVTCKQDSEILNAIAEKAADYGIVPVVADRKDAEVFVSNLEQLTFSWKQQKPVTIHLAGAHQLENAVLAIACVEELQRRGYDFTQEQIEEGLKKAQWPGRFTVLRKNPYFIVDGAHNPDAAGKLVESLQMYFPKRKMIFLLAIFRDKQYEKIVKLLSPMAEAFVAMETPDNDRALPAEELTEVLRKYHTQVTTASNLEEAAKLGMKLAGEEGIVVACGSLSFIGDMIKLVKEEK